MSDDVRIAAEVMLTQYMNGVRSDPNTKLSCWCCKSCLDRFINEANALATEPKSTDPAVYFHKLLYKEVQSGPGFVRVRRLVGRNHGGDSHNWSRQLAEQAVEIMGGYTPVCCMLPESWWPEAIESFRKVHGVKKRD